MSAAAEVRVPRLAESIADAVVAEWLKPDGARVRADEPVATLETDKAAVEIAASAEGVLRHARAVGDRVVEGDVLARVEPGAEGAGAGAETPVARPKPAAAAPASLAESPAPARSPASGRTPAPAPASAPSPASVAPAPSLTPAARRMLEEHGLSPGEVTGTGLGGRILREDIARHVEARRDAPAGERVVPMSRIRQRIAERLVQAQRTAAILTTFNEIDMSAVIAARERYREIFERKHGVRLGFMSFFSRASVLALADVPEVNAEIRGTDIVYRDFVHLGIAVSTPHGLVVPVARDAQQRSLADLEREIARLAERARERTIALDELTGGTFTISNGGVYGSLLSTPILNPPQSGILGMHKIEKRPIVVDDQVVVRPMMYVALSYDHRLVDGEQAVTFLVRVKERLEAPERLLLEV